MQRDSLHWRPLQTATANVLYGHALRQLLDATQDTLTPSSVRSRVAESRIQVQLAKAKATAPLAPRTVHSLNPGEKQQQKKQQQKMKLRKDLLAIHSPLGITLESR